jgi:hypothetical protein
MDFIEREGAVSDELTSVLSAISEKGRPLRVKRAAKTRETRGQFRRIQVANSREIKWRKPVKSAPIVEGPMMMAPLAIHAPAPITTSRPSAGMEV